MIFSCRFFLGRCLRCVFFTERMRNDKSSSPKTKLVSQMRLRFNALTVQLFNDLRSFLSKNDARLGQIVGRKLHLHFVARDDADEMFAHFAGDVREDRPLTGQLHAKHRARQHLRHRSFRHDLLFLGHRGKIRITPRLSTVLRILKPPSRHVLGNKFRRSALASTLFFSVIKL